MDVEDETNLEESVQERTNLPVYRLPQAFVLFLILC